MLQLFTSALFSLYSLLLLCLYVYMYIYILSKGLQCALTVITIMALWQLLHLGHRKYVYTLFELHCEVTRVLKM